MSDPIRELEIANAQLAGLRTELATMAELYESQRKILHTVAVERDALAAQLAAATGSEPGRGTGVWVPLDKWTELQAQLARKDLDAVHVAAATFDNLLPDIERFGADQWRNGNAGREPQEFLEWKREKAADRRAAFNGGEI